PSALGGGGAAGGRSIRGGGQDPLSRRRHPCGDRARERRRSGGVPFAAAGRGARAERGVLPRRRAPRRRAHPRLDQVSDRGHPVFAWIYSKVAGFEEKRGLSELRAEVLTPAEGRVVEIGAGTGLNFERYPPGVHVVAT